MNKAEHYMIDKSQLNKLYVCRYCQQQSTGRTLNWQHCCAVSNNQYVPQPAPHLTIRLCCSSEAFLPRETL